MSWISWIRRGTRRGCRRRRTCACGVRCGRDAPPTGGTKPASLSPFSIRPLALTHPERAAGPAPVPHDAAVCPVRRVPTALGDPLVPSPTAHAAWPLWGPHPAAAPHPPPPTQGRATRSYGRSSRGCSRSSCRTSAPTTSGGPRILSTGARVPPARAPRQSCLPADTANEGLQGDPPVAPMI